jgi:protein gp37
MSKIEWTGDTWNPVTGCTKLSPGCDNCYAERMANRLKTMEKQKRYKNGFKVTCHPDLLDVPLKWKKAKTIFVCSMSDLFHKDVPVSFIKSVFDTMNKAPQHTFQVLTKRSKRLYSLKNSLNWTKNIWMGVTVENSDYFHRIDRLRKIPAHIRFLSIEPLLGPIRKMDLSGMDWVITGGESGPGARPIEERWVINIKNQCVKNEVPFFFKQWGGTNKKKAGRLLRGKIWDQMPETKD